MAAINNPALTVTTNPPKDRATVVVSCDIEFTDVEVNAMNLLGLVAQLVLKNEETQAQISSRTAVIAIDLVA